MLRWLESFLLDYDGAFVVISHDRYFLDKVTNLTWELEHQRLTAYKGNYTRSRVLKEEQTLAAQRQYDNTKSEIDRLYGVVEQQRRWNREKNIKTAESKLKAIRKLEESLEEDVYKRQGQSGSGRNLSCKGSTGISCGICLQRQQ